MPMTYRRWIWMFMIALIVNACAPVVEQVPTLVPTPIPPTETPTPEPTATDFPTPEPTRSIPQTSTRNVQDQAFLRVVHGIADADALDFYVEELNFATGLTFSQITEPSGLIRGEYTLRVVPTGGRPLDGAIAQLPFAIQGQQTLIAVVIGTRLSPQIILVSEDTSPLNGQTSRLKLVNGLVSSSNLELRQEDGTVITRASGLGSTSDNIALLTRFITLTFYDNNVPLINFPINLREREHYTLIPVRNPAEEKVSILQIRTRVNGISNLTLIGGLTDTGEEFDVYLNQELFGLIGNRTIGPTSDIESGTLEIELYPAGADTSQTEPILVTQTAASPDDTLYLIILGTAPNFRTITHRINTRLTPPGFARVSFVHALDGVLRADLSTTTPQLLTLSYGQISDALNFAAEPTSFGWVRSIGRSTETGEGLQQIEQFELEAGVDYLFFLTGDATDSPFYISREVGAEIAATPEPLAVQTVAPQPRLRGVNALPGRFVEFRLDDIPFATDMPFQTGSAFTISSIGERVITVVDAGTQTLLARDIFILEEGKSYTAFVRGIPDDYRLFIIEDGDMPTYNGQQVRIRLVNLTNTASTLFGFAHASPSQPPGAGDISEPTSTPDPNAENEFTVFRDPFRRSIPLRTIRMVNDILSSTASEPMQLVLNVGARDLLVVDAVQDLIAATIYSYPLSDGQQYDLVAFQLANTTEVAAFVVQYPGR